LGAIIWLPMQTLLITGSEGELGQALIDAFLEEPDTQIVAFDIREAQRKGPRLEHRVGDITNASTVNGLFEAFRFDGVVHLAAILSSGGERNPERTHEVNVDGSMRLLCAAQESSQRRGKAVKFIFPSTIAVHGIPADAKRPGERIKEEQFNHPITMYGVNKLYIEQLGTYFSHYYKLLTSTPTDVRLDFRALRYPGIVSAETIPSGGTSDYGSEMVHAAAKGEPYACFVPPAARLPFMIMPDAVQALRQLFYAAKKEVRHDVYNVSGFTVTAEQIATKVLESFPDFIITYDPNPKRTQIVESWPADIDDSRARNDWGWRPQHDFDAAFSDYLIPRITQKYGQLQRIP